MTKIIIPVESAEVGGTLFKWFYNNVVLGDKVSNIIENGNRIIDDTNAIAGQKLVIDEAQILEILAEGGEIENYLFAIKQPISSGVTDVPEGVPSREFRYPTGTIRNFSQWFGGNAEVWINDTTNEFIYYVLPNPSDAIILKASEAEIIRRLDPNHADPDPENRTFFFHTVAEVQAEVAKPNWVKL